MSQYKIKLLRPILKVMSDELGIMPLTCLEVLARGQARNAPQPELLSTLGHERYARTLTECQRIFRREALIPFSEFSDKRFSAGIKYEGPKSDTSKMRLNASPALSIIYDTAYLNLSEESLFCIAGLDLNLRAHKLTHQEITDTLGKKQETWYRHSYNEPRTKLRNVLAKEHPGMENHPVFDPVNLSRQRVKNPPHIADLPLNLGDRNIFNLYSLSQTLFEADEHFAFCNWFLVDPEKRLTRKELATKFGVDNTHTILNEPSRLGKRMMRAVECEPNKNKLAPYLSRENEVTTRASKYLDLINEREIILDIPFVKKALDVLYTQVHEAEGREAEIMCFTLCRLYNAKSKRKLEDAAQSAGISITTAKTYIGTAKTAVKKAFIEADSSWSKHPFLKTRDFLDDVDERAQQLMYEFTFSHAQNNLSEEDKFKAGVASTMLNPKQYYALFCTDFKTIPCDAQNIAERLGVTKANVRNYLKRARKDLNDAMAFEKRHIDIERRLIEGGPRLDSPDPSSDPEPPLPA